MMKQTGIIIKGLDIVDLTSFIGRKGKKFQATLLSQIEDILGKDTEEYTIVRKYILDSFNAYERLVIETVFGEIEDGK